MEDRRIQKTKRSLKDALLRLLSKKPFEKITVTELCENANTSRITFYTYYSDKYDLADDYFQDMSAHVNEDFHTLQKENNPQDDPVTGYCNLLDAMFNLHESHKDFFQHSVTTDSPYLFFSYYWYVLRHVEEFVSNYSGTLKPRYSEGEITGFLCNGLWGFIRAGKAEHQPLEKIRFDAKQLMTGMLTGELFKK